MKKKNGRRKRRRRRRKRRRRWRKRRRRGRKRRRRGRRVHYGVVRSGHPSVGTNRRNGIKSAPTPVHLQTIIALKTFIINIENR